MQVIEANGARIPAIGLGTWELRGRVCARIVEQALRFGYRHIDTAQMYDNERDVGEGLRASGVPRARSIYHHKGLAHAFRARPTSSARSRKASRASAFPTSTFCCCTGPVRGCRWSRLWAPLRRSSGRVS